MGQFLAARAFHRTALIEREAAQEIERARQLVVLTIDGWLTHLGRLRRGGLGASGLVVVQAAAEVRLATIGVVV